MKLAALFLVAVVAVAPPRIELQLDESLKLRSSKAYTATARLQPDGSRVMSRKDYTVVCAAGDNAAKCPLPKAKAFDSVQGEVAVNTKIYLVDKDGAKVNEKVDKVNRKNRATYLVKFDAKDSAGNHAEQVVVAIEFADTISPIIRHNGCRSRIVEAKTSYVMCSALSAKDNIDGDVTKRIRYTITRDRTARIVADASLAAAARAMSSNTVGSYRIVATVSDKAGVYGTDGSSNSESYAWKVTVRDTTAPIITVTGADPHTTECAKIYKDFGATATDTYDPKVAVTINNGVLSEKKGQYSVHYSAADKAGNAASQKTRTVVVTDTTPPKVSLKGPTTIEINAGSNWPTDAGAKCNDSCDGKLTTTGKWVNRLDLRKVGSYTLSYSCTDQSGNSASATRTYTVVDRTAPILTMIGKDSLVLEAHPTSKYTDQGAHCHDYVNGNLNAVVRTRNNNVLMNTPGTYNIYYDCKDESGNKASPLMRKVVVQDTTCPKITISGANVVSIEAGFPYKDSGATANDSLDGDITSSIRTWNSVDTAKAFYAKRSCAEIKSADKKAKSGMYYITSSTFKRVYVFCDMKSGKTWNKCSNCKKTVPSKGDDSSCAARGLTIAKKVSAAAKAQFGAAYATVNENTNSYLCTVGAASFDFSNKVDHDKIAHAETGKYIVSYTVKDKAGNKQCQSARRTVIVSDTLPPVIALKLNGKLIHTSGTKDSRNPAYNSRVNPFLASGLMAEESVSVNGWVIGAMASAVAGLALLGLAAKKPTVVSVPV